MAWGRLHDRANGDAKLLALSDAAWRMWGCGLIYCQANLTDGFIPDHVIELFGVRAKNKRAVAEELCRSLVPGKAPLWHRVEGGYRVHDYLEWNESRERVQVARLTAKQRIALLQNPQLRHQVRARDGDRCRYCGRIVRWNDRKGELGGTYDHVQPYAGNSVANLVVCCRSCNSKKRGRAPEEAGMVLLGVLVEELVSIFRSYLDISKSEPRLKPRSNQASTYHVRTSTNEDLPSVRSTSEEKQERGPSPLALPVDAVENTETGPDPRIRVHRRIRSQETVDGRPAVNVIAALARDVLMRHPHEDDDLALRDILKGACAKANLRYDGSSVAEAIDRARAQLKRRSSP